MKSFVYAYKTSDGVRHEDAMEAASKEEVFETLRGRGIRPIKVIDRGETPEARSARRRRTAAALAGAAALGALAFAGWHFFHGAGGPQGESAELTALRVKSAALHDKHQAAMTLAGTDVEKAVAAIDEVREEARSLFADILSTLPAEEHVEAKRLYGELMMFVDESELSVCPDD